MSSQPVNPLNQSVPIVHPNGTPTWEFMRKWEQQNATNGTIPDLTAVHGDATIDADDLLTLKTVNANPGTFGDSTHFPIITVDAKGRVTVVALEAVASAVGANPTATASDTAVNGTALTFMRSDAAPAVQKADATHFGLSKPDGSTITSSGGVFSAAPQAGTPLYSLFFPPTFSFTVAHAAQGNVYTPKSTLGITKTSVEMTTVTGATYNIGIAAYDTVNNKVLSAPTYSTPQTVGSGVANDNLIFDLAFTMTGGTAYIVFIVRTNGTTTTNMTISASSGQFWSPGLVVLNTNVAWSISNQAPGTSDVWSSGGTGQWSLGIIYSL